MAKTIKARVRVPLHKDNTGMRELICDTGITCIEAKKHREHMRTVIEDMYVELLDTLLVNVIFSDECPRCVRTKLTCTCYEGLEADDAKG